MTTDVYLRPCPFCGSGAEIAEMPDKDKVLCAIECPECEIGGVWDSEEEGVPAWNQRDGEGVFPLEFWQEAIDYLDEEDDEEAEDEGDAEDEGKAD